MQNCPFTDEGFDAALAWGVIFHLTRDEQARALASVSRVLRVGAPFLFTAGDVNDVNDFITGTMNGVTFRYYSFGVDGYRALLNHNRLTLVDVHKDDGANTYYLARKTTS